MSHESKSCERLSDPASLSIKEIIGAVPDAIVVLGARENNLQSVNCAFPLNKFSAVIGPSGSGKSSLVFQTIHAEAKRRFLALSLGASRVARPSEVKIDLLDGISFTIAVRARRIWSKTATVASVSGIYEFLQQLFLFFGERHCLNCGHLLEPLSRREIVGRIASGGAEQPILIAGFFPRLPQEKFPSLLKRIEAAGFTRVMHGQQALRIEELPEDASSGEEGLWVFIDQLTLPAEIRLAEAVGLALGLGKERVKAISGGAEREFSTGLKCANCGSEQRRIRSGDFRITQTSLDTKDYAFPPELLALSFGGRTFGEIFFTNVLGGNTWINACQALLVGEHLPIESATPLRRLLRELSRRFDRLNDLGVSYLELYRPASSLSGGELQRVQLVRYLSFDISGVTYLLDEPSIGLHPRDTERLIGAIKQLCVDGNTVIAVEHDSRIISAADSILELGPGGGINGGRVIRDSPDRPSAAVSDRDQSVLDTSDPVHRNNNKGSIVIRGARKHNLKGIDVVLPLGAVVAVTGLSGSGKSTLIVDTLLPAIRTLISRRSENNRSDVAKIVLTPEEKQLFELDDLVGWRGLAGVVDATELPHARSSRSTVATASGLLDLFRGLFAMTPEARVYGFSPKYFSFNTPQGACATCRGRGKVQLASLPSGLSSRENKSWGSKNIGKVSSQRCPLCKGRRFSFQVDQVHYHGMTISEVMELTVEECLAPFSRVSKLVRILRELSRVGLGYLKLSQSTASLSMGEQQRLRLVKALCQAAEGDILYFFDEPSRGLSPKEIQLLLGVFHRLTATGSSVVVIEHSVDIVRSADYVIDLGPGAGAEGGEIIAAGTPPELKKKARLADGKDKHAGIAPYL